MSEYLRLRQICLVARELEPAVDAIQDIFGVEVCHRDPLVGKYGLVNALFVFGHAFLEIVAPTREGTTAERFLDRSDGRGGYMAIFDCNDPLARRERARQLGVRIAHVMDYANFKGSQFHPRDCRATMLEFDHTTGGESLTGPYYPAGDHWLDFQRLDKVSGIPMIDISSPDHLGLAKLWSSLFDVPLTDTGSGKPQLQTDLGAVRFVGAPSGDAERLDALHVTVGNVDAVRKAAERRHMLDKDGRVNLHGVLIEPVATR